MRPGLARRLLRHFWIGLGYFGCAVMGMTPKQYYRYFTAIEEQSAAEAPTTAALPPPAHPERLVPDEPLSEEASRLWAQLDLGGPRYM